MNFLKISLADRIGIGTDTNSSTSKPPGYNNFIAFIIFLDI